MVWGEVKGRITSGRSRVVGVLSESKKFLVSCGPVKAKMSEPIQSSLSTCPRLLGGCSGNGLWIRRCKLKVAVLPWREVVRKQTAHLQEGGHRRDLLQHPANKVQSLLRPHTCWPTSCDQLQARHMLLLGPVVRRHPSQLAFRLKHPVIDVFQSCFELDRDVVVLGTDHLLVVGTNQANYITIGLNRRCEPSLHIRRHVDVDSLVCCCKSDGRLVLHRDWLYQARPQNFVRSGCARWRRVVVSGGRSSPTLHRSRWRAALLIRPLLPEKTLAFHKLSCACYVRALVLELLHRRLFRRAHGGLSWVSHGKMPKM